MKRRFLELLGERVLLGDGGMGTMLYAKGVFLNACFDELNLTNPALVREVHRDYVRSGADIIETNTFGANRRKLLRFGLETKVRDIHLAGAALAREEAGPEVLVAGSIGPLGAQVAPLGPLPAAEAEAMFAEQASALAEGGVDLFILETFPDVREIELAVKAVRAAAPGLPVIAQMTIDENGDSLGGTPAEMFTARLDGLGADVIGINCSVGPAPMLQCLERMAKTTARPLSVMPNAGMPREVGGRLIYLSSPDYMAEYAKRFVQGGAKVVGGCCGTTPAHIKAMRFAVKALQPPPRSAVSVTGPADEPRLPAVPAGERSRLGRKLAAGEFVRSVEIVPPRGHDPAAAVEAARELAGRGVDCVNIPDGPRASARMSPMALATILSARAGIEVILHYTCRDRNLLGMQSDFLGLQAAGVRNMLIVTGDPPKLGDYPSATAVYDVDSIGLTGVVAALNRGLDIGGKAMRQGTSFLIGVGVNPGAANLAYEIGRFHRKIEAGADFAITQPVFDTEVLDGFLRKIGRPPVPVLIGIWPLWSLANAEFMNNEVPGASVPPRVMERMRRAQARSPESARDEGVAISREVLRAFKDRVQGVQVSPPLGKIGLALDVLDGL
ncbi:MAG TPA: bifunctional homocysteine S-methyltransferase/methylenetetrahydrofolate reductase [Candidatus Aminicenantes bacterium]|nr:bifunctional homocysteine S-methyltransferase/methylenetetrahydrofolate reductase [Candidatus Aminicenantes bacterium]